MNYPFCFFFPSAYFSETFIVLTSHALFWRLPDINSFHPHNIPAAAKSLQSFPTLCDPIDGSPPGSPVPGILQARTLEWVAISFSNAWKWKVEVKSLSDPIDCSLPASSAHGIFQARLLEWGAIAFSHNIPRLWEFSEGDMEAKEGEWT